MTDPGICLRCGDVRHPNFPCAGPRALRSGCRCSLRERVAGDGCNVCNPALALKYVRETLEEVERERDEAVEALRLIASTDPIDAALDPQRAVRVARAVLAKIEGEKHGID